MRSPCRIIAFACILAGFSSCSLKPEPEPLSYSTLATLNLLQDNAQFVMYLNFKTMRRTEFWQKHVSDSLLNAEKTFGSLLNTFRQSTGASISEGLDELYYSNSWLGENAIVLKGLFNRAMLDTLLANDSNYSVTSGKGAPVYMNNENGLYFFFKDNFTICASNYLRQIDQMMTVTDTSNTGLLVNNKMMTVVQSTRFKENFWMVTAEKMFIRGMLLNMIESTSGKDISDNDSLQADSTLSDSEITVTNLYRYIGSLGFSGKMDKELRLVVQGNCISEKASEYLAEMLSGLLTVARLSGREKQDPEISEILKQVELERYGEEVMLDISINDGNISDFRKRELMKKP